MITKKELLKNLKNYTPQEISDAIKAGVASMYELGKESEGAFTPLLKKQVKAILEMPSTDLKMQENSSTESIKEIQEVNQQFDSFINEGINEPSIEINESSMEINESSIPIMTLGETFINNNTQNIKNDQSNTSQLPKKSNMFSHPFSFKGRIRRTEYWITFIISCLVNFSIDLIFNSTSYSFSESIYIVLFVIVIFYVTFIWFLLAQNTKRCHDLGNSGFYQLIPFYGLWLLFKEGEKEINKYGVSPK